MSEAGNRGIGVLGCGWFGEPLAARYAEKGWRVHGTTTSPSKTQRLEQYGIRPFVLRLGAGMDAGTAAAFLDVETLVVNVPPPRPAVSGSYRALFAPLLPLLESSPVRFVVFVSSTGVYPNLNRVVREEDADAGASATAAELLDAERLFLGSLHPHVCVLRFGGLYGYDRHPAKYLAGRREPSAGGAPVNLIHRDDCIGVAEQAIALRPAGAVLSACADEHPTRRALYTHVAQTLGLEPPHFQQGGDASFKIVSNERLKRALGYRFKYSDPMQDAP